MLAGLVIKAKTNLNVSVKNKILMEHFEAFDDLKEDRPNLGFS